MKKVRWRLCLCFRWLRFFRTMGAQPSVDVTTHVAGQLLLAVSDFFAFLVSKEAKSSGFGSFVWFMWNSFCLMVGV
jgi:hypothetical protein